MEGFGNQAIRLGEGFVTRRILFWAVGRRIADSFQEDRCLGEQKVGVSVCVLHMQSASLPALAGLGLAIPVCGWSGSTGQFHTQTGKNDAVYLCGLCPFLARDTHNYVFPVSLLVIAMISLPRTCHFAFLPFYIDTLPYDVYIYQLLLLFWL